MPQPRLLVTALVALAAGCASRQRPTEYPPGSALSPQAKAATPVVVTRAFHDDLQAKAAPTAPEAGSAATAPEEHHHGHHHH